MRSSPSTDTWTINETQKICLLFLFSSLAATISSATSKLYMLTHLQIKIPSLQHLCPSSLTLRTFFQTLRYSVLFTPYHTCPALPLIIPFFLVFPTNICPPPSTSRPSLSPFHSSTSIPSPVPAAPWPPPRSIACISYSTSCLFRRHHPQYFLDPQFLSFIHSSSHWSYSAVNDVPFLASHNDLTSPYLLIFEPSPSRFHTSHISPVMSCSWFRPVSQFLTTISLAMPCQCIFTPAPPPFHLPHILTCPCSSLAVSEMSRM